MLFQRDVLILSKELDQKNGLKGPIVTVIKPKPVDLFLVKMKSLERVMEVCTSADVQFAWMNWE